jgi:hypothetical protein
LLMHYVTLVALSKTRQNCGGPNLDHTQKIIPDVVAVLLRLVLRLVCSSSTTLL